MTEPLSPAELAGWRTKCKHCGKPSCDHKAGTHNCPGGRKHRTHGYPWFHHAQRFEPVQGAGMNGYREQEAQ